MRVVFAGAESDDATTSLGVAQGAKIGPLIFLLFINDLPEYLNDVHLIMYADDTSIAVTSSDPTLLPGRVSGVVDRFQSWCRANRIMLNLDKTEYLNFHQRRRLPPDPNLSLSSETKFLGLRLDDTLSFSPHIQGLLKQLNSACYALLKLRGCLDRDALLQAYFGIFYSRLSYGVLVWGRSVEWSRVFVAQKRAVRVIFGLSWRESCRNTFRENSLLTLPSIYILRAVVYVKKNIHLFAAVNHAYATRTTGSLRTDVHHTALYERSPQYDFVKLYNKLPNTLKNINDIQLFKTKVRKILIGQVFYDYREYLDFNF